MKRVKRKKLWQTVCSLILVLTFVGIGSLSMEETVFAGASDIVIDNNSFNNELDLAKWNNPSGDVVVKEGKIIFPKESTGNTRLITKSASTVSKYHDQFLQAEYVMKLNQLPKDKKFILAFGLANLESYYGESGNLEVTFENQDALKVSVIAFDESGQRNVLQEPQAFNCVLGQEIKISVAIAPNMETKIVVNGKTIFDKKIEMDLAGRIGFLQTGSCEVEISDLEIVSHKYEQPENVNVEEDFESGSMNVNALTSKMIYSSYSYPAGIHVEEYKGNHVLMFRNAGIGYLGTKYSYSNFEISFDIPYMQHDSVLREDGTVQLPSNGGFVLSMGDESEDYGESGYEFAIESLLFEGGQVTRLKDNSVVSIINKEYYRAKDNVGYSVKVTVEDATVKVYLKTLEAATYDEIMSYKSGNLTPFGYIHIWASGQSNFAIDNLKVTNKDKDAKLLDMEYKAYEVTGTEDFEYEPVKAEYLNSEGNTFGWWIPVGVSVAIGGVIIGISVLFARHHKTPRKKEAGKDEL